MKRLLSVFVFWFAALSDLRAQVPSATLADLDGSRINRAGMPQLARVALSVPNAWKHAETTNFIYHFTDRAAAANVASEAEFYYRVIARELEKDTRQWEHKAHIFIFGSDEEWKAFQSAGQLDPRTGGLHAAGALFLKRRPAAALNDETLAHEIAHLVIGRFFGSGTPMWLNEGFAENSAIRCRSAFFRARGYSANPRYRTVSAAAYLPLGELTALATYPADTLKLLAFYDESEKLTRFLMNTDKKAFGAFLDGLSKGNRFETALTKAYGGRFMNLDALEREFKPFAISSIVPGNP